MISIQLTHSPSERWQHLTSVLLGDKQGDQIGQNFANSLIVYVLWVVFAIYRSSPTFVATFHHGKGN
jgi:hypothetical protein